MPGLRLASGRACRFQKKARKKAKRPGAEEHNHSRGTSRQAGESEKKKSKTPGGEKKIEKVLPGHTKGD